MLNENLTRVLLTFRDSSLLIKIFTFLFPNVEAIRYETSRNLYKNPTLEYKKYLKEIYIPGKTLIFDSGGSFKTGLPLFLELFGVYPRVHLACSDPSLNPFPSKTTLREDYKKYDELLTFGLKLEILNRDIAGILIDVYWDEEKQKRVFLRAPANDYNLKTSIIAHQTVDYFCLVNSPIEILNLVKKLFDLGKFVDFIMNFHTILPKEFETSLRTLPSHSLHDLHLFFPKPLKSFLTLLNREFSDFFDKKTNFLFVENLYSPYVNTKLFESIEYYFGSYNINLFNMIEDEDGIVEFINISSTNIIEKSKSILKMNQFYRDFYDIVIENFISWNNFLKRFFVIDRNVKSGGLRVISLSCSSRLNYYYTDLSKSFDDILGYVPSLYKKYVSSIKSNKIIKCCKNSPSSEEISNNILYCNNWGSFDLKKIFEYQKIQCQIYGQNNDEIIINDQQSHICLIKYIT
jgi:hypothetical protein